MAILQRKKPKGFTLIIHYNGKKIDFEQLRPFSNGLKYMRKKMAEFVIDFKIENEEGSLIKLFKQTR